jgi:hypothetical protein
LQNKGPGLKPFFFFAHFQGPEGPCSLRPDAYLLGWDICFTELQIYRICGEKRKK